MLYYHRENITGVQVVEFEADIPIDFVMIYNLVFVTIRLLLLYSVQYITV